jgi:squalene synthase HpnC
VTAHLDGREALAKMARRENFPVASRLLPADVRDELMAIYAFARYTDDLGDESAGDRLAQLDALDAELDRALAGTSAHPVLEPLSPVLARLDVGVEPFRSLIEANRMDQRVHHYDTFAELRAYCMLSAAPIGRIVLSVFGATTQQRVALSDDVCVGLQLTEHLQDVREDAERGRVYLPREDMARCGCDDEDLQGEHAGPALRRVIALEEQRARALLAVGPVLGASLPRRPRVAVIGFAAGGLAALDAVRGADHDVLGCVCRPTRSGFARQMIGGLRDARKARTRT